MSKQDYPAMIYHIVQGTKIVNNKEELQFHEKDGWIKDYKSFSEIDKKHEKIAYHKRELEKLGVIIDKPVTPVPTKKKAKPK